MDAAARFRSLLDGTFLKVSWVQDLMDELRITGISQVWGETLGYYVWFSDAECSYGIRLESSGFSEAYEGVAEGIFGIRCFPYVNARIIDRFSPHEQALLRSRVFDHTNTPRYECQAAIPSGLFSVGGLQITIDPSCDGVVISLASLDNMVTRYSVPSKSSVDLPGANTSLNTESLFLRNVPAWSLAYTFFDRLVSMFAFSSGSGPVSVLYGQSPGFELLAKENARNFRMVDSNNALLNTAVVVFQSETTEASRAFKSYLDDQVSKRSYQVLFQESRSRGTRARGPCDSMPVGSLVNPQWWTIAHRRYTSKLGSTCGCT